MLEEVNIKPIFGIKDPDHFALIRRQILIPLLMNRLTAINSLKVIFFPLMRAAETAEKEMLFFVLLYILQASIKVYKCM